MNRLSLKLAWKMWGAIFFTLLLTTFSTQAQALSLNDLNESEDEEFFETLESEKLHVPDPLEKINRPIQKFNDFCYKRIFRPLGKNYRKVLPAAAQEGISNFFNNLKGPVRVLNNVLQLKFRQAAREGLRFVANTSLGLAGVLDPATESFHLKRHPEDFGQTLGYWGLKPGVYLQLPFLGPSNLRDLVGGFADGFVDPQNIILRDEFYLNVGVSGFYSFHALAQNINTIDEGYKMAVEPYSFFRDAYWQNRQKQVEE